MSLLAEILRGPESPPTPLSTPSGGRSGKGGERRDWDEVVVKAFEANRAEEGSIPVSESTALRHSAVFACVRILAETLASLPLIIYERMTPRGKQRATGMYLYPILHDRPNELMTSFEYRETIQGHLALWGNAYSQVVYDARGRVEELWPLNPGSMLETKVEDGKRLYHYMLPNGQMEWISGDYIWHLRGLGGDGLNGYSVIGLMRKAVSLGLSAEAFGKTFFDNDARPGIVLEHPARLSDQAHTNLKNSWNEEHKGVDKSHRLQILEEGMKLHEVGIPPEDAQFLETRRFQVEEIARAFRIPPHMLADLERATFSNIEHQGIEFVVHTMRPWLVRWEQSINQNLLLPSERGRYFAEFLVDGLLRGDTASRYQAYNIGRQGGWLSANDVRELENMNPIEGGDEYLVPMNMVPAGASGTSPAGESSPRPSPKEGEGEEGRTQPSPNLSLEGRGTEERAKAGARKRHALMRSYRRLFLETANRVVGREVRDVKEGARLYLQKRDIGQFEIWMEEYYRDFPAFLQRQFTPVSLAYGETVAAEAGAEAEAAGLEGAGMQPEAVENFTRRLVSAYVSRHVYESKTRLQNVLQKAEAGGENPLKGIEEQLQDWEETRGTAIANEESCRQGGAVAQSAFEAAGAEEVKWHSFGKSCPYCRHMDGKTVGIRDVFVKAGEELPETAGTEEGRAYQAQRDIKHPPLHGGCECMIGL